MYQYSASIPNREAETQKGCDQLPELCCKMKHRALLYKWQVLYLYMNVKIAFNNV